VVGRRQFLALRRGCRRLLTALARVPLTGEATAELDALCQPVTAADRHVAAFNPIHPDTANLFAAVLTSPSTGSATSRANSTLPRPQTSRMPSAIARHASPRPHHKGQEQSALSPHRQRLQGHLARRPLPPHRLPHSFPSRPSRIETSAVMPIPGEELHTARQQRYEPSALVETWVAAAALADRRHSANG
jgi:hypothetical protein